MRIKKEVVVFLSLLIFLFGVLGVVSAATGITINYPNGGEYVHNDVGVTWTLTGTPTGLIDVKYSSNGGSTWTDLASLPPGSTGYTWNTVAKSNGDGNNYKIYVIESGTSVWDWSNNVFTVDNTNPTSFVNPLSTYQNTLTFNVPYTANDNIAGVNYVELYYKKDSGSWTKYGTTFSSSPISFISTSDGVYQFYTIATDRAGNIESKIPTVEASTTVDTTVPTINDDYTNDGVWVNSPQTITLTPTDTGSGINNVKTCEGTGCAPLTILSSPYQLIYSTSKNIIVRYQTWDNAGNPSEIGSFDLKIDLDVPIVDVDGAPVGLIVDKTGVIASVVCSDGYSGCDDTTYKFKFYLSNPGSCSTNYAEYTDVNPVTGHKWVCGAAKDNVGNTGFSSPVEFTIFNTIQSAVDAANQGDTINVGAGTYAEQVTINKNNLVIQSTDGVATTIIDVTGKGTSNGGIIFNGNENTFDGFTVRDYSDESYENKIIRINSNNNIIQNNIIQGNLNQGGITDQTEYGILFQSTASGNLIDSNEIYDIGYMGINIAPDTGTSSNTISNNNVHDIGIYAIGVDRSPNNIVTQNTISNLVGGTLWGNYYDPAIWSWGIVVWGAGATGTIIDNQDLSNLPNGIVLSAAQGVTVKNSKINNNQYIGLKLADSSWISNSLDNNIIENNEIYDNGDGIIIKSGGYGGIGTNNIIRYNQIYDNSQYGVKNEVISVAVNAINNWWGHITGPYHPITNVGGQGDEVSDNVLFKPWSINTDHDTDEIPPEIIINSPDPNSWHNFDFILSITDTDTGGSGLYKCEYRVKSKIGENWEVTKDWTERTCNNPTPPITVGINKDCKVEGKDTNGKCRVFVRSRDKAGNEDETSRYFAIDWTSPTGSIVINSGATYTNNVNVGLTLTYNDNLDTGLECRYSNDGSTWSSWESCTPTKAWILSLGDGTKTVYYEIQDDALNTVQFSDSIILDTQGPIISDVTPGDITIQVGNVVTVTATVTDENSVVSVKLYDDQDQLIGSLNNIGGNIWSLTSDPFPEKGNYRYYLIAEDEVGNQRRNPEIGYYTITVNDLIWTLNDSEWNLVSTPKNLVDNSILTNEMWYYDPTEPNPNDRWKHPTTINPGIGYWVNNTPLTGKGLDYAGDCTGPSCLPSGAINIDALQNSWNLIGLTSTEPKEVWEAFSSQIFPDDHLPVFYVIRYNEFEDEFELYPYVDFTMNPGEGYWVYLVK